ncbi:hypothetical protein RhiirB3_453145 [Rhizophagus irregularis]|nr:hypothetical protein RhiirB3_453145 [Rhizophagus irregularis]
MLANKKFFCESHDGQSPITYNKYGDKGSTDADDNDSDSEDPDDDNPGIIPDKAFMDLKLKKIPIPEITSVNHTCKELKWCKHSLPNLKKIHIKPKTKNTPNKKPGNVGQIKDSNKPKKKDKKSLNKTTKSDDQLTQKVLEKQG